jgi:hypothetical protein
MNGRWYWERIWLSIGLSTAAVVIALVTLGNGLGLAVALVLGAASVMICPTPP